MLNAVQRIKTIDTDGIDTDDAVALLATAKAMKTEYRENFLEVPDWLTAGAAKLEREVRSRRRESLEKALANAVARKEALKSADEKRRDAEAEIERLRAALNG
jgi:Skp family chaperone for outer membrane proteins